MPDTDLRDPLGRDIRVVAIVLLAGALAGLLIFAPDPRAEKPVPSLPPVAAPAEDATGPVERSLFFRDVFSDVARSGAFDAYPGARRAFFRENFFDHPTDNLGDFVLSRPPCVNIYWIEGAYATVHFEVGDTIARSDGEAVDFKSFETFLDRARASDKTFVDRATGEELSLFRLRLRIIDYARARRLIREILHAAFTRGIWRVQFVPAGRSERVWYKFTYTPRSGRRGLLRESFVSRRHDLDDVRKVFLSDDTIFIDGTRGGRRRILALSPDNGKPIWSLDMPGLVADACAVGARRLVWVSADRIRVVNALFGREEFSVSLPGRVDYATVRIADGAAYVYAGLYVYSINLAEKTCGRFQAGEFGEAFVTRRAFVGLTANGAHGFHLKTGTSSFAAPVVFERPGATRVVAEGDDALVFADGHSVFAVDSVTGTRIWSFPHVGAVEGTIGEGVFAAYLGEDRIRAIHVRTGNLLTAPDLNVNGRPRLAISDGQLLAVDHDAIILYDLKLRDLVFKPTRLRHFCDGAVEMSADFIFVPLSNLSLAAYSRRDGSFADCVYFDEADRLLYAVKKDGVFVEDGAAVAGLRAVREPVR